MTDTEKYNIVHSALFESRSCNINKWFTIVLNDKPAFEAMINSKGFIHIRKPFKRLSEPFKYLYDTWRFTSKKELVNNGMMEGIKPLEDDRKVININ